MRQLVSILLTAILLSSTIPGCLSEFRGEITLVVNYEKTNGTMVESYIDGEHISTTNVSLEFDFSNTESERKLAEFGVEFAAGRDPVSVDSDTTSTVTVEFADHGIYEIVEIIFFHFKIPIQFVISIYVIIGIFFIFFICN